MKTEKERILEEWLKNPFWREYYEEAPSDRCREFIALEFCYSEYEEEETAEAMDRIEENLGIEDLRHLLKYVGYNPRKGYLAKRIAELEAERGDDVARQATHNEDVSGILIMRRGGPRT